MRRLVTVVVLCVACSGSKSGGSAKTGTLDELAESMVAALKQRDAAACVKLGLAEKKDRLEARCKDAIEALGANAANIKVKSKECQTWGDKKEEGECRVVIEAGGKEGRVKVDDSRKTADGWRTSDVNVTPPG